MNCLNNLLIEGGAGVGARVEAGVGAQEITKEEMGVLLLLVRVSNRSLASLFLPPEERLQQKL